MSDPVTPLLLLGTRTFAEEMADVIGETPGFRVEGFVENMDRSRCQTALLGLPVHWIDDIGPFARTHMALAALSTTHRHRFTDQAQAMGVRFATVVHPSAQVSRRAELAEGVFINRGAIIAGFTKLGRHVLVNRGASIGHHTTVGEFTTLQPGAVIAGLCEIGPRVYIGLGAKVIDRVKIGGGSVVGAGAVVVEDVPPGVQVLGVPARVVKEGIEGK